MSADLTVRTSGSGWVAGVGEDIERGEWWLHFRFLRLYDSSRGVHSHIEAYYGSTLVNYDFQLKIDSPRSQKAFAAEAATRARADGVDWAELLAAACLAVIRMSRTGTEIQWSDEIADPGPVQFLVNPLMPRGEVTMIYGDSKAGKTMLAMTLAAGLAWKLPKLSSALSFDPAGGGVCYCDWESTPETFARRLRGLANGWTLPVPRIAYRRMIRPVQDDVDELRRLVDDHRFSLVVIDSVGAACGANMVDGTVAAQMMAGLRSLGTTVLAVHHISADTARNPSEPSRAYGSVYFRALARANWELRGTKGGPGTHVVALRLTGANDIDVPDPIGLSFRYGAGGVVSVSGIDPTRYADLAESYSLGDRLKMELTLDPATVTDLGERLDKSADTVKKYLSRHPETFRRMAESGGRTPTEWGLVGLDYLPSETATETPTGTPELPPMLDEDF